MNNLIAFDLSWSLIRENWIGWSSVKVSPINFSTNEFSLHLIASIYFAHIMFKFFQIGVKLKMLNLKNCRISKAPDFSAFLSLETLILESCKHLVSVEPSIGLLRNLIILNLKKCWRLKKLPEQMGSTESLVKLSLTVPG